MAIDDNTSYELTGYQVKDLASKIRAKADSNSLASVATSGLYSDLTGAPTIPTVYNGTLTIQQNGTTLGTFSANQDTNETINITGGGGVITTLYWDGQSLYKDALFQTLATGQDVDDAFTNGVLKISDGSAKTYLGTGYNVTSFIAITSADSYNGIHLVLFEDNMTSWDSTRVRFHDFFGATSSTAGTHGFVPAPAAGDEGKVLHGDGTWKDTTAKLVEMSYGESNAWAKFIAAYNAGSIVYCRASSNANPATGSQTRKAFMAYVNNATNPTNVEFQYVRSQSSKTDSQQCDQVFVYKLTNASGGTWTVESRNMAPKINVDGPITKTFTTGANATVTIGANAMTGATSGAAGTAGVVPAPAAGDQNKVLKADATWGKVGADNIDFTTMPVYTDAVSNIALTTSYTTWAKVTIDVPGKYLLLLDASSQSSASSYALYSRFAIGTSTYNGNYVTVPSGGWGHISNMCVVDISAANTEVKAEFNSTVAVAASSNTRANLTAVRIG